MRLRPSRGQFLSIVVLTLPLEVEVPGEGGGAGAPDSAQVSPQWVVDLIGGGGSYAIIPRDCDGSTVHPITEVTYGEVAGGAALVAEHWRFGARGGWLRTNGDGPNPDAPGDLLENDFWYANPYLGADWKWVGAGAGLFWSSDDLPNSDQNEMPPLSANLRLGPRKLNVRASLMEAQPVVSGGGYFQLGVGFAFRERDAYFVGLSVEPYDGGGLVGAMDLPVHERVSLLTRLRVGSTEDKTEGGLALGLRWSAGP